MMIRDFYDNALQCHRMSHLRYPTGMEKKPVDDSKNRFAEVIRKSQQRRQELNEKARKKQMEDVEPSPRDEEGPELEENEPGV
jgi:hypothetical protein